MQTDKTTNTNNKIDANDPATNTTNTNDTIDEAADVWAETKSGIYSEAALSKLRDVKLKGRAFQKALNAFG